MSKKKKRQTVGYRYGMTMHMAFCHGPVDQVSAIDAGERPVWLGVVAAPEPPPTGLYKLMAWLKKYQNTPVTSGSPVTSTQSISISAWAVFGGDDKEGGMSGVAEINMGEKTQSKSALLTQALGGAVPAFRGILTLVYKGLVSANSTYLKPIAVTVSRIFAGWHIKDWPDYVPEVWYPGMAAIGVDMNPAHIIYQCLTDYEWGMGYPYTAIDGDNFASVAEALYEEGFGLSLIWNQQGAIQSFVQIICNHINGALRVDPVTGKFQIKLIRPDYTVGSLPIFGPSNIIEMQSFQRAGWGETINELVLAYTDPDTRKETAITVHDLANIQAQGQVVSQKINYPGICTHALAQKVAMRDLLSRSTLLAKAKFTVNRSAWRLVQGDVFRLSWPALGISSIVLRVVNMSTGTLDGSTITIEAVEDVFGLPSGSYAAQQESGWDNPQGPPAASPARRFVEATYFDLATTMTSADMATVQADDGYLLMHAQRPSSMALDYLLKTRPHGSGDFAVVDDSASHCVTGILTDALIIEEHSALDISSVGIQVGDFEVGNYAIVGSEYVRVDEIDPDAGTIVLARGVVDTVPQAHTAGSRIFFAESFAGVDPNPWPSGAEVDARVITRTNNGILADADAPIDTLTIAARHNLPYPPGRFRINGSYRPDEVENTITVSWAHRNRFQQTVYLLAQDDASVTLEPGVTYGIRIYDEDGVLSRTLTGLTGTSYIYPLDDELADCGGPQARLTVELYAERDGLESWQAHSHTFDRVYTGWGFDWGNNWGGN